jgi:thiol-disulfide isomerase/thioredoxin
MYSGFQRDAHSLRQWLFGFIPSLVEELTPESFEQRVLNSDQPWLVDFYAPWCGHCVVFAPEFQIIAQVHFVVKSLGRLITLVSLLAVLKKVSYDFPQPLLVNDG